MMNRSKGRCFSEADREWLDDVLDEGDRLIRVDGPRNILVQRPDGSRVRLTEVCDVSVKDKEGEHE